MKLTANPFLCVKDLLSCCRKKAIELAMFNCKNACKRSFKVST